MTTNGYVGLILVSHSQRIAEGLAELVAQVAGPDVPIEAIGGGPEGTLGTDGGRVHDALRRGATGAGSVVLMDLGSSVLAVRSSLAELDATERAALHVADAPLVEGAVAAGVTASMGADAATVAQAAEEARGIAKL
ncbi:MAG: dihydroxyacetone kinase phosphoryl donor subunit DhaM [Actinomycetota bacterium]|nr:dihydroxyacetone kinase phosphoryl donor subunit DhaM [Actinomycetota bacterium]